MSKSELREAAQRKPLTEDEIEKGREETFSVNNPFCPCDRKTMLKAVRWAEHAHGISAALTATTNEAAAQADGRGSDLRLLLIDLDMRLRECVRFGLSAAEAYDSAYQEAVATALATQPVQAQGEADCWIDPHGLAQVKAGYSRCHTVATERSAKFSVPLYTHPAPAVDRGLSEAQEREAFEDWAKRCRFRFTHLDRFPASDENWPGQYKNVQIQTAWEATQARAALAASAPSQAEPTAAEADDGSWRAGMVSAEGYEPPRAPSQAGSCQASGEWATVEVNQGFPALMEALDRAARKGYMPDSMTAEWEAFEYRLPFSDEVASPPAGRTLTVLQRLVGVIDSAGLLNLSNGVQLGPHAWLDKASKVMNDARAILAASSTTAGERG